MTPPMIAPPEIDRFFSIGFGQTRTIAFIAMYHRFPYPAKIPNATWGETTEKVNAISLQAGHLAFIPMAISTMPRVPFHPWCVSRCHYMVWLFIVNLSIIPDCLFWCLMGVCVFESVWRSHCNYEPLVLLESDVWSRDPLFDPLTAARAHVLGRWSQAYPLHEYRCKCGVRMLCHIRLD